jgi:hypothetical protein
MYILDLEDQLDEKTKSVISKMEKIPTQKGSCGYIAPEA